jgi:DNA (cytosine-5)-methyltransferase 1
LDAQYFGLAQRRRRVFVVASSRKGFNPAEILFEFSGERRDKPPCRKTGQGITADAQGGTWWDGGQVAATLTVEGAGGNQRMPDKGNLGAVVVPAICAEVSPTVTNGPPFSRTGNERVECDALVYGMQSTVIGRSETSGPQGMGFCEEVSYTLTKADQHGVVVAPPHAFKIRGGCEGGGKGYLGQDEQAFTITCGHDQQVAVPTYSIRDDVTPKFYDEMTGTLGARDFKGPQCVATQFGNIAGTLTARHDSSPCHDRGMNVVATQYAVRRLTPIECERLQGFPDNYTNIPWRNKPEAPDGPRYKALGNSWAVPVVTWIGQRIKDAL